MKILFFDTHSYEKQSFEQSTFLKHHELTFIETRLTKDTAILALGHDCVCAFVNDKLDESTLRILSTNHIKLIALRSAGFNHVDLPIAKSLGLQVVRVPEYSPYAIAEHVVAMVQTLNRSTHKAYNRVREGNFSLNGLVGHDLHGKTFGIVGCGKIGKVLARIMSGFGCIVLLHDIDQDEKIHKELHCEYADLDEIFKRSDIISLHLPLNDKTKHIINAQTLSLMKKGVMIINTGRGGLIETRSLIDALKSGHIGHAGLDVYEEEQGIFFNDMSDKILSDDILARLLTFPNVLVTSHQGFLTYEALANIADTTLQNISAFENGEALMNQVL